MVNLQQVVNGITQFLDNEMLPHMTGWQKWTFGVVASLALNRAVPIFNEIKNKPIVKALQVISADDNIDIDTLYRELHKQAQKGAITVEIPGAGAFTFKVDDVENLYRYIIGGK